MGVLSVHQRAQIEFLDCQQPLVKAADTANLHRPVGQAQRGGAQLGQSASQLIGCRPQLVWRDDLVDQPQPLSFGGPDAVTRQ